MQGGRQDGYRRKLSGRKNWKFGEGGAEFYLYFCVILYFQNQFTLCNIQVCPSMDTQYEPSWNTFGEMDIHQTLKRCDNTTKFTRGLTIWQQDWSENLNQAKQIFWEMFCVSAMLTSAIIQLSFTDHLVISNYSTLKPGVGLRSSGLEFEPLWNNTRWVYSACHPSEVCKMSTSLLGMGTALTAQPCFQKNDAREMHHIENDAPSHYIMQ